MNRPASFEKEIRNKERFEFGKNWKNFLKSISDKKITQAEKSIKSMLGFNDLTGKTFLDIGSGSGIFSLAAKNLGAQVHSFDYDKNSFWCTNFLKENFYPNDNT
jgi:ribosomal protein L11 methylase PrmA